MTAPTHADPRQPPSAGFLGAAAMTEAAEGLFDADRTDRGWVMNLTHVWAHQPEIKTGLFQLIARAAQAAGLTMRQRGILVAASASARRDSYCSLAWANRLSVEADPGVAAGVIGGDESQLDDSERALARWARAVATDPNGTTGADVELLRAAGYDDAAIVAITAFIALRVAFSTANGALGIQPDRELADQAPREVLAAITFGRPIAEAND
jgi:alkylhydroperoxidase family enzyme